MNRTALSLLLALIYAVTLACSGKSETAGKETSSPAKSTDSTVSLAKTASAEENPAGDSESDLEEIYNKDWAATYFPIEYGSYWIYEGKVSCQLEKGKVAEKDVRLRTDVVDESTGSYDLLFSCNGYFADILNLPRDLLESKQSIIVVPTHPFKYHLKDKDIYYRPVAEGTKTVREDLILSFPLVVGKSFANESGTERADHWYEWYVKEMTPSAKWHVGGKPGEEYHLMFYTNPDRTDVWFVPGVGITRYVYHHNGTVMDVDVTLKEYRLGGK